MRAMAVIVFLSTVATPASAQQRIGQPAEWLNGLRVETSATSGAVTMELDIGLSGMIAKCRVIYSQLSMDQVGRICTHLKSKPRHKAAGDLNGRPKPSVDIISVSFVSGAYAISGDFGGAVPTVNPGTWATNKDYPTSANRRRAQGIAYIAFKIGLDGRVSDCTLTKSSGDDTLDATTCALISKRARFKNPLDQFGKPLEAKGYTKVRWAIH